jgi:hypothetical protein
LLLTLAAQRTCKVPTQGGPAGQASQLDKGSGVRARVRGPRSPVALEFGFFPFDRDLPSGSWLESFVVAVALVARLRGIFARLGIGFAGYVLVTFMLPALLDGESGVAVAVVGASAVTFVALPGARILYPYERRTGRTLLSRDNVACAWLPRGFLALTDGKPACAWLARISTQLVRGKGVS